MFQLIIKVHFFFFQFQQQIIMHYFLLFIGEMFALYIFVIAFGRINAKRHGRKIHNHRIS